jgi:hypothetical protein
MLVVVLAGLLVVSAAWAGGPSGDFARFKQCPRFTPGVNLCFYSTIYGGQVTLGKQTVPLNADGAHEIVVQGGITQEQAPPFKEAFVGALNGETLSKTPQNVPGGLLGMNCAEIKGGGLRERLSRRICKAVFENRATGLRTTTELARPASEIELNKTNLVSREGPGLTLPVKIHLENPLLGNECYIGSSTNPIVLALTTGTTSPAPPNTPITGSVGQISLKDSFEYVEIQNNVLVNNEFSAPEATGCGGPLAFLIDPLINNKIGLPSPEGHNTIIQDGNVSEATTIGVNASETPSQPAQPPQEPAEEPEHKNEEEDHHRPGRHDHHWRH